MAVFVCEFHICARCYYFRSAIVEKDVPPEQDWGLCAIRSSQTADSFSPEASKLQKAGAKVEETQVEGTHTCRFWTKDSAVNL
jgi:hypothetical protein